MLRGGSFENNYLLGSRTALQNLRTSSDLSFYEPTQFHVTLHKNEVFH